MPVFTFKSPDGRTYNVTAPEGATQAQAWELLQQTPAFRIEAQSPAHGDAGGRRGKAQPSQDSINQKAWEDWNNLPWYARATISPDEMAPGGREARTKAISDAGEFIVKSQLSTPAAIAGLGGEIAGRQQRLFDDSVDPEEWARKAANFVPHPEMSPDIQQQIGEMAAPVQKWLDEHPATHAAVTALRLPAEAYGTIMGLNSLSNRIQGAIPTRTPAPKLPPAPATQELGAAAKEAFRRIDNSGATANYSLIQSLKKRAAAVRADGSTKAGFTPATEKALEAIEALPDESVPFSDLVEVRDLVQKAQKMASNNPVDLRTATRLKTRLDNAFEGITDADISGAYGPEIARTFKDANNLYSRYQRASELERILEHAQLDAAGSASGNLDNALRRYARNVLKSQKRRKMLTPEEEKAYMTMAVGTPVQNVGRSMSAGASSLHARVAAPATGAIVGAVGGAAGSAGGAAAAEGIRAATAFAGRTLADRLQTRNWLKASEAVRRGGEGASPLRRWPMMKPEPIPQVDPAGPVPLLPPPLTKSSGGPTRAPTADEELAAAYGLTPDVAKAGTRHPAYSIKGANNASGESVASMEAISRLEAEKAAGIRRLRVNSDGGYEPLIGVDAVDAKARPGQVILQVDKWGNVTVLDRGIMPKSHLKGLIERFKSVRAMDEQ